MLIVVGEESSSEGESAQSRCGARERQIMYQGLDVSADNRHVGVDYSRVLEEGGPSV